MTIPNQKRIQPKATQESPKKKKVMPVWEHVEDVTSARMSNRCGHPLASTLAQDHLGLKEANQFDIKKMDAQNGSIVNIRIARIVRLMIASIY